MLTILDSLIYSIIETVFAEGCPGIRTDFNTLRQKLEEMYEDISKAIHSSKILFDVVMGYFNEKLGKPADNVRRVGQFGIGQWNVRQQLLAEFTKKEGLFMMNSFFKKRLHRKWAWIKSDWCAKIEIDYIMSTKRRVFNDVSVS